MKLFVCGSPYAGMSVVGQALADAKFFLGGPLGLPTTNDAVGLFVNRAVVALHDEILASAGCHWLTPAASPVRPQEAHRERAGELLRAQFVDRTSWAILDPRAALLADMWRDIVPDARWVFVVRPPAETAWVMLRRRLLVDPDPAPVRRLARALAVWNWYARQIVQACRQDRDRTALLFAPDDFGRTGDAQLAALTGSGTPVSLGAVFHPQLLRTASPKWVRLQARLQPDVNATWQALREIRARHQRERRVALQPGTGRSVAAGPSPRTVCVVSRRRLAISETFIRDHLRYLPATMRWLMGGSGECKRDKNDLPVSSTVERALAAALAELGHLGRRIETRGLTRYLRREGVHVVLAEFGPVAVDYIDACQATGIPLVAHFHGYDAYKRSTLVEYGNAYRRLFHTAHTLVVVSTDMSRQLQSLGAPEEKIIYNPCGVDTSAFAGAVPELSAPVFVSVGRFVEKKAPHYVLRAFHEVASRRPDARLVMIGEGVLLDPCRQLCDALGLSDRVRFTGAQSPAEVASFLRSARAFVQHSMRDSEGNAEGTPVSILEAGATGLPVVSTRHMGIADVVVHGETGLLVEEGDIRGMGEHLVTLYDDPTLAGMLGRRGRVRVSAEFSMQRSISRLWNVLERAMERSSA